MKGWRLAGFIIFVFLALMEVGDWGGLVPGYTNPKPYADLIGITPAAEQVRLIILTVLALGIIITASATAIALWRRTGQAVQWSRLTALMFMLYGLYQIVAAVVQLGQNQIGVGIAGALYILIGVFAVWLGARAERA